MLAEGDLQVRILVDKAQIHLDDVAHKVTGALVLIVAVKEIPQVVDGQHDLVRVGGDIREGRGVLPLDDDIHPAGQQLEQADGIVGRQLDDAVIGIEGEHFAQADEVRLQLVAEAVGQSAVLVLHAAEPVENLVVGLAFLIRHFLVPNEDETLHEADVDVLHGAVDIGLRHLQKFRQLRDIDLVGPQVLVPLHDLGDCQTDQLGFHQRQIGLLAPQQLVGLHDIEVLAVTDGDAAFPGQIVFRCLLDQRLIVTFLSACIYIRDLDLFFFHVLLLCAAFCKFINYHILFTKKSQPNFSKFVIFPSCPFDRPAVCPGSRPALLRQPFCYSRGFDSSKPPMSRFCLWNAALFTRF